MMIKNIRKFPVQILSDIHLNNTKLNPFKIIHPKAPNLILAGDITELTSEKNIQDYSNFLRFCSREFDRVYMISGNHEYYYKSDTSYIKYNSQHSDWIIELQKKPRYSIQQTDNKIKKICSEFPCITYLQKRNISIPEYSVSLLGCTLWSQVPTNFQYLNSIEDFKKIYQFNINTRNIIHKDHKEWLNKTLKSICCSNRTIVLTHHAPLFTNVFQAKYEGSYFSTFFASKMDNLYPYINTWIYGHTHKGLDLNLGGKYPRFISNPMGYPNDDNLFSPNKIFYL